MKPTDILDFTKTKPSLTIKCYHQHTSISAERATQKTFGTRTIGKIQHASMHEKPSNQCHP